MLLAACQPSAAIALGRSPAGLEQVPLQITSAHARHRFIIEVARSPDEQRTGLMNRPQLAPDRGMIFPFSQPEAAIFWMKDTLIPLDMVFIRANGRIARIAANATPLSLDPVAAGEPVGAVLEIKGGRAAQLGIRPGDKVRW